MKTLISLAVIFLLATFLSSGCKSRNEIQDKEVMRRQKTIANLNQLKQALSQYKGLLPGDPLYVDGKADNSHLLAALKEYGITEEHFKDGWGRDIYYDRLVDPDGLLEINRILPGDPVAREHPSDDMTDDEEGQIVWDFVIWSLGSDVNDKSDDLSERGKQLK